MISQSLEVNLIPYLLDLLGTRLDSAVKAQIVSALKAMTHNLNYGERVSQVLLKHPAWAEFKDQRHDLFIKDTSNVRGYLTGKRGCFSMNSFLKGIFSKESHQLPDI